MQLYCSFTITFKFKLVCLVILTLPDVQLANSTQNANLLQRCSDPVQMLEPFSSKSVKNIIKSPIIYLENFSNIQAAADEQANSSNPGSSCGYRRKKSWNRNDCIEQSTLPPIKVEYKSEDTTQSTVRTTTCTNYSTKFQ